MRRVAVGKEKSWCMRRKGVVRNVRKVLVLSQVVVVRSYLRCWVVAEVDLRKVERRRRWSHGRWARSKDERSGPLVEGGSLAKGVQVVVVVHCDVPLLTMPSCEKRRRRRTVQALLRTSLQPSLLVH